ncbi:MAG: transaldolase, partial [Actinomycetota bacterium]|nr:transaldolase [Actinomycetota bacterium]
GRSINVTLIFSLERYESVMEAYLGGLEDLVAKGGDPSKVASVASFFVSRVDTETDRRLEAVVADDPGSPRAERARSLRGRTAVAQARTAYEHFERRFAGPRWEALAARGARVQRPLWASTSTKNPAYSDLAYVDTLIGPSTVNTMPEETLARFLDHGKPARTVDADVESAHRVLTDLGSLGISMSDVAETLEDEGVTAFEKSFDEVIERLSEKASRLGMRADGADA